MTHGWGQLDLMPNDIVSDTLGRGEYWDTHVYDALEPYLDGDVVDLGANVGALTMRFAQQAPRVIAFEPNQNLYDLLVKNIKRLGLTNVIAIPEGVYSAEVRIRPDVTGYPPSSWTWLPDGNVRAGPASWDDDSRRVSAIKSDIQGADLHGLIGMEEVILRDHPRIVFEFERELALMHGHTWNDYLAHLDKWGYRHEQILGYGDYFCDPVGG